MGVPLPVGSPMGASQRCIGKGAGDPPPRSVDPLCSPAALTPPPHPPAQESMDQAVLQRDQPDTWTALSTPSVQGIHPGSYWSPHPSNSRCAFTQQVAPPPPFHLLCSDGPVMPHESDEATAVQ